MMIEVREPDDFHHHLRDGESLSDVVKFAARSFRSVIVMPNLKPPVRTVQDAISYRNRILQHSTEYPDFNPLMTLYLTDNTSPEDIQQAKSTGLIHAVKYYPAGATTNSEFGVTSLAKVERVLQTMSDVGMLLLVHGEVTDVSVDIFDREKVFIETILRPILEKFPNLKVVMEHITTSDAVEFVTNAGPNLAATITAHHLLYNRNDIFKGGVCPHMYCLPILKREQHRQALLSAATSGNPKFFIGTDSAPHSVEAKESACGCAGIFTGHAALELYAEAFESANALHRLEDFTSRFGQEFYGLPLSEKKVKLLKQDWIVPETFKFGNSVVKPLRANQAISWERIP